MAFYLKKKCGLIATPLLSLLQKKNKVKFLLSPKNQNLNCTGHFMFQKVVTFYILVENHYMQPMPHYNVNFALSFNYNSRLLQFQQSCLMTTFSILVPYLTFTTNEKSCLKLFQVFCLIL